MTVLEHQGFAITSEMAVEWAHAVDILIDEIDKDEGFPVELLEIFASFISGEIGFDTYCQRIKFGEESDDD